MARVEPASAPRAGGGGDLLLAGRLVCDRCRRTPYHPSVFHTPHSWPCWSSLSTRAHRQVFPESLVLSGGATLALGWGGFAALHYGVAPALMAREGADGLGRPARTALLYATGLCVVRSEGPPALCRALSALMALPLSAVELWPLGPALCETMLCVRGRETNRRARRCEQHSAARGRCAAGVGCGCCGTLCSRQAAARRTAWHRGWPHMAAGWRCSCSAVRRHLPSPSAPQRLGCCCCSSSSSCGS